MKEVKTNDVLKMLERREQMQQKSRQVETPLVISMDTFNSGGEKSNTNSTVEKSFPLNMLPQRQRGPPQISSRIHPMTQ